MNRVFYVMIIFLMVLGLFTPAGAALIVRGTDTLGNQLIYDTDLDITWYDFSTPIHDTWISHRIWASGLTVDFGGATYNDWRLPYADYCFGKCSGGELGHLYYSELGNSASGAPLSTTFTDGLTGNPESFRNLWPDGYWYETEYSPNSGQGWFFFFNNGAQDAIPEISHCLAMAVRPGDVSAVPEPATLFFMGSSLAGVIALRKKFL